MKRRTILGIIGVVGLLVFTRCHWVAPLMGRPDAIVVVKTTGYCSCRGCCGWRINWFGLPVFATGLNQGKLKIIGQTASGRMARPGTVAVDPAVFPLGTRFYIPGYGWARAEDTGGGIVGNHLDLFFWWHSSGERWGVQPKRVKVWYPKE